MSENENNLKRKVRRKSKLKFYNPLSGFTLPYENETLTVKDNTEKLSTGKRHF